MMEATHIINPLRESGGFIEMRVFDPLDNGSKRRWINCTDGFSSCSGGIEFNEATAVSIWNDRFRKMPMAVA